MNRRLREGVSAAAEEHRKALGAFTQRASRVRETNWHEPSSPGKWSPAQITAHLRLALERLEGELSGKDPMRCVLPWWKRMILRRRVLPRILRTGLFPPGVPAPREIRPDSSKSPRDEALRHLVETHSRFESACGADASPRRRLTHPYFGRLSLERVHRLLALHTLHHRGQLPAANSDSEVKR